MSDATSNRVGEQLYVVSAPALGCVVWAQSAEQAVQMAREAWVGVLGADEMPKPRVAPTTGVVGAWFE